MSIRYDRSIIGSINLGTNLVLVFFFRAVISYGILSFGSISIKLMVDFSIDYTLLLTKKVPVVLFDTIDQFISIALGYNCIIC